MRIGDYEIGDVVGEGPEGVVYRAVARASNRTVAVKVLHDRGAHRDETVAQLVGAAKAASGIRHCNLVEVLEVGTTPKGTVFLATELLEGESLADRLGRGGHLPLFDAINIVRQVAHGLAAVHEAGILHGGLKPTNIFLCRRPGRRRIVRRSKAIGMRLVVEPEESFDLVKLRDFGMTRFLDSIASAQAGAATKRSILPYLSPEQARGQPADVRSDLYAFGAVFYEMITGMLPFEADSLAAIVKAHDGVLMPASRRAPRAGIDARIDGLIIRCLKRNPAFRFGSIGELCDALDACVTDCAFLRDASRLPGIEESGIDLSQATPEARGREGTGEPGPTVRPSPSGETSVSASAADAPRSATAASRPLPPAGGQVEARAAAKTVTPPEMAKPAALVLAPAAPTVAAPAEVTAMEDPAAAVTTPPPLTDPAAAVTTPPPLAGATADDPAAAVVTPPPLVRGGTEDPAAAMITPPPELVPSNATAAPAGAASPARAATLDERLGWPNREGQAVAQPTRSRSRRTTILAVVALLLATGVGFVHWAEPRFRLRDASRPSPPAPSAMAQPAQTAPPPQVEPAQAPVPSAPTPAAPTAAATPAAAAPEPAPAALGAAAPPSTVPSPVAAAEAETVAAPPAALPKPASGTPGKAAKAATRGGRKAAATRARSHVGRARARTRKAPVSTESPVAGEAQAEPEAAAKPEPASAEDATPLLTAPPPEPPPPSAEELVREAQRTRARGHYAAAIAKAEAALKADATPAQARQAYEVIGTSSCALRNGNAAREAASHLDDSQRAAVKAACEKSGVPIE